MRTTQKRKAALIERVYALERRVHALERRLRTLEARRAVQGEAGAAETLAREFPMGLHKSDAADWLKVSRATVYVMIRDGRLEVNDAGRVTAESMARLMHLKQPGRPEQ